jgi:spore maturation protein CgeB
MDRFFTDAETVYFDGADDLAEKILYYNVHDGERAAVASAGRRKYHRLFNGARVLKFMVETMTGEKYSEAYEWAEEVYR